MKKWLALGALLVSAAVLCAAFVYYNKTESAVTQEAGAAVSKETAAEDETPVEEEEPKKPLPNLYVNDKESLSIGTDMMIVPKYEGHGDLSFTSYDENVVTVSDEGMLSAVGVGHTSVRVYLSEDEDYRWQARTISVDVTSPDISKTIFLTFDDGPSGNVTPEILDVLKEHNAHATFFVIGKYAEAYPEVVKRAYDEGHTVAIHTYTHDYRKIYASLDAYISDFDETEDLLENITGETPRFWRFPGGGNNGNTTRALEESILSTLHERGYTAMDWTVSSTDASPNYPSFDTLYSKCKEGIDGAIASGRTPVVLMHDSETKSHSPQVAAALIEHYSELGYDFRGLNDYYGEDIVFMKSR